MFNPDLYNTPYHTVDLKDKTFLITGGAGFIGSNIVEYLLKYGAGKVRVLDNLSNGYFENIKDFMGLPNFEFVLGDIRDYDTCVKALDGIDYLSHQAALGSVPRSIGDPITSNDVNVSGFLNMLTAAKESKTLKRMVYAASSSTYGDSPALPKVEGNEGNPLSPYAVTKLVNELYGDVYSRVYGFHTIGLRYFNVFGPKQNPNNPYAAVIPIFCKHFLEETPPTIHGDGLTSRDFTFVENAVQANLKTLLVNNILNHDVFNIACGEQSSLNDIVELLVEFSGQKISPVFGPARVGDVKHSKADIKKIIDFCGYNPVFSFYKGLKFTLNFYKNKNQI
jgi:UDP-N-acetylglucosamine 4-epimerase